MSNSRLHWLAIFIVGVLCTVAGTAQQSSDSSHFRIYVTNERSGDLSEIDASTLQLISTVPLGKRPRGIHASPDHHFLYIALSGSPLARSRSRREQASSARQDRRRHRRLRCAAEQTRARHPSGSDPENFDLTKDGRSIIVSNEDDAKASFIDIATGKVTKISPSRRRTGRRQRSVPTENSSTSRRRTPARFRQSMSTRLR